MKNNPHKAKLQIIENDNLYGLANINGREVVECVYDKIKPLQNGKFIVIKNKLSGILDSEGKILLYLQPHRLYCISIGKIDIFKYKSDDKVFYFSYIENLKYDINVDRIRYNEKIKIVRIFKNGILYLYNEYLEPIQTGFDRVEVVDIQGTSMYLTGRKDSLWGVFEIKCNQKHKDEVIIKTEPQYNTLEEALQALKDTKKRHRKRKCRSLKD